MKLIQAGMANHKFSYYFLLKVIWERVKINLRITFAFIPSIYKLKIFSLSRSDSYPE